MFAKRKQSLKNLSRTSYASVGRTWQMRHCAESRHYEVRRMPGFVSGIYFLGLSWAHFFPSRSPPHGLFSYQMATKFLLALVNCIQEPSIDSSPFRDLFYSGIPPSINKTLQLVSSEKATKHVRKSLCNSI